MNATHITNATARVWAFTNLGMGYGLAQRASRIARRVASLLAQIGLPSDEQIVVDYEGDEESYDEDWGDYRHRAVRNTKTMSLRKVLERLVRSAYDDSDRFNGGLEPDYCGDGYSWDEITSVASIGHAISSTQEDGQTSVYTVKGWEDAKREERRKELEQTASNFARECGHSVGTREFVKAVKEHLAEVAHQHDRWNDGECQMERWATCLHSGSRDAYWSDNDYMNGKFASERGRLADVLSYMRENFPLLMLHIEQEEATSDA